MTIYTSPLPDVHVPSQSLYTCMFSRSYDPASPAFTDALSGRTLTRAELRAMTLQAGHGLRTQCQVKRGDTVLIFSPNSLAWPVALLGIIAAGARATLANSAYTPQELAHQYTDSRARVAFVHPDLVPTALQMFKNIGISLDEARRRIVVMELGRSSRDGVRGLQDLLGSGALEKEEAFDGELANETVLLCYSSGTTGKPKGVETTHRNLTAMLNMLDATKIASAENDIIIATLPYYHIYGVVQLLLWEVFLGISTIILPKFSPEDFCAAIERYKVTTAFVVPPIVLALVHHPAVAKYNMKSLVYISSGAAPLSGDLVAAARKRLGNIAVGQGYGLTETSPVTHVMPRHVAATTDKIGSVGPLIPNLEARLVTAEGPDGEATEDAKLGQPGEVWVRGPSIMKGYLNRPDATANSITPTGWFKTGDIGIVDEDGFYSIVDRKKELIKYKGFQVPPAELEGILLQHPDIVDAAVIGIEDPAQATELPRAYVVYKDGIDAAPKSFPMDVQKWIAGRVAKHKFLRGGVVVVDVIPKSAAGKILRRELRERAKAEVAKVKAKL
ncbi:AMP binding protein [Peniophora sp. CONT]|nr:AMP binding protein [Peniophora sp. CONT]